MHLLVDLTLFYYQDNQRNCIQLSICFLTETMKFKKSPIPKKMINEMQFRKNPQSIGIRPIIQHVQQPVENLDPKEEAVLKQVREFLYQNMVSNSEFGLVH